MESPQENPSKELGGRFVDGGKRVVENALNRLPSKRADLVKRLLRDRVARLFFAFSVLTSSGCGNVDVSNDIPSPPGISITKQESYPTPTEKAATPTASLPTSTPELIPTPKPTEVPTPVVNSSYIAGVRFQSNERGIPVSYQIEKGKEIALDTKELERVKEQAIKNKEPEIFTMIRLPSNQSQQAPPANSVEHPVQKELPKDVLSFDELKKRGIEIIQADNTWLSIRKGAFEKGGPLEDYKDGAKNRLKIVLVNGPSIPKEFMKDPKYNDVEKYRAEEIKDVRERIKDFQLKRKESQLKGADKKNDQYYSSIIEFFKAQLYIYEHITGDELYWEVVKSSRVGGYFTTEQNKEGKTESIVYVAVGQAPEEYRSPYLILSYDEDGAFQFSTINSSGKTDAGPKAQDSHPDPSMF
ncbi:MAG: hypothetical protein Q7S38_00360, partial [bacterium]|nr:hypothetical protein [bacterium]